MSEQMVRCPVTTSWSAGMVATTTWVGAAVTTGAGVATGAAVTTGAWVGAAVGEGVAELLQAPTTNAAAATRAT